ncbi:MAG: M48 family metalloprotease [Acidobacteriota bacterium]|nr:M48 family metalloprotease [Acidobacteriota bacterium]
MRGGRLLIGVVIAIFSIISYYASREDNPITGEKQAVGMSQDQELALGQEAAPQMAREFGGLDPDPALQAFVDEVGNKLVQSSDARKTDWKFEFSLLGDAKTVNAFALPGGPIFITKALLARMTDEAQLAGVLGHEIGHVVARHAAEQAAKTQLGQGLVGAVAVGTSDGSGVGGGQLAQFVAQMTMMKYGREDELQSDSLGVRFMADAGYDPRALIDVMDILADASGGQPRGPEFSSTHPDPGNRKAVIENAIRERYPNGVQGVTRGRTIGRN